MASTIGEALEARDVITDAVRSARAAAAGRPSSIEPPSRLLPSSQVLQKALAALESDELSQGGISAIRRGALYAAIRGGFASAVLSPRLREVHNDAGDSIGQAIFDWMSSQLQRYKIRPEWLATLEVSRAVEATVRLVRFFLMSAEIEICDPENVTMTACRRTLPGDMDFVTTITTAGEFPRTLPQLAVVFDPRNWSKNPNAPCFIDVHAVTAIDGLTEENRPEAPGETWAEPSIISEEVTGMGVTLTNTLIIQFVVTSAWARFTYSLGQTIESSSTLQLDVNSGYIYIDPIGSDWCRISLEKNVRFSGLTGMSGGDIGWGNLANGLAPDIMAKWLEAIRYMPCWTPAN